MPNDAKTMSDDTNTTHQPDIPQKSRFRETLHKFTKRQKRRIAQAKINSDTNSWSTVSAGTSTLIEDYLKINFIRIFTALITKEGQEKAAMLESGRRLFKVDEISSNKQSTKKAINFKMGIMNFPGWPYALLKIGLVSFNSIVDTLDRIVSPFILKSVKSLLKFIERVTFSTFRNSQGSPYTDKIEDLINELKETSSLPARAIKRLVNFAAIVPETILLLPIDAARKIDSWLDNRAESAAENTASGSNVVNTAQAAIVPVAETEESPADSNDSASPVAAKNDSQEILEETHSKEVSQETAQQVETQAPPKVQQQEGVQQDQSVQRIAAMHTLKPGLQKQGLFAVSDTQSKDNEVSPSARHSPSIQPFKITQSS